MKRLLTLALLGLAGCSSSHIPVADPVPVRIKSSAENQFKESVSTVRSFRTNAEGKRVEFGGAVCSGENSRVSFSVVTPGKVSLPTYLQADRFAQRGKPPAIVLRCRAEGQTVQTAWEPGNSRNNQRTEGTTTCTGATCNTPSALKMTSRLSPTLPWGYPTAEVDFP